MNKTMACILTSALLIVAGCSSIAGTWQMAPGQPAGSISFGTMTLANDGTFTAEASYNGDTRVVSGYYEYRKGEISFDAEGKSRAYGALLVDDELTLTHENKSVRMNRLKSRKGWFK